MNRKNELLGRAYVLLAAMLVLVLLLVYKTADIAVINQHKWVDSENSKKYVQRTIEPTRGNILADNGALLATSVAYFDVFIDFKSEAMTDDIFEQHVDSLSIHLSQWFLRSQTPQQIQTKLRQARTDGKRYYPLVRSLTYEEYKRLKALPFFRLGKYKSGLAVEQRFKRLKPFQHLASRTIGLHRTDGQSVGLEESFNDALKGVAGSKTMFKAAPGLWLPVQDVAEIRAVQGNDVLTTINVDIQDIAHHALEKSLRKYNALNGLAVVMEVETGAIKAISNLASNGKGSFVENYNHAIGRSTEPGSTFKLASALALLEDGKINLGDTIDLDKGRMKLGKYTIRDSEPHDLEKTDFKHAFAISSNIGMAKLIREKYGDNPQAYIDRLHQFGLNRKTGIEIKGEEDPVIPNPDDKKWSKTTTLPVMSYGYELKMSALQTLSLFATVANNGVRMKPYIVKEVVDPNGRSIERFKPQVLDKSIASEATIKNAQELLIAVCEYGTGKRLNQDYIKLAGKSGTAKLNYWTGEDERQYQSSFVGYFPAEKPKYACIVVVTKPEGRYYGSTVAGPVFSEIAEKIYVADRQLLQEIEHVRDTTIETSAPYFHVASSEHLRELLKMLPLRSGGEMESDYTIVMPAEDKSSSLKTRSVKDGVIPNVVGMGLRDALFVLENLGLHTQIRGHGRVLEQSIEAGAKIDDQTIILKLG